MTVREYIVKILMEPLKKYRTPVQDAILELMIEYFEEYHVNIKNLPSIVEPNKERYDILTAIAASYGFTIRPEAMIEEQTGILANIAYVYKLRGSIYSIEHMKELYGGNLPSPVHIDIPSYGIFRYCISAYDQSEVYEDGTKYRPGIYDVHIYRYFDDVNELATWMYKELVTSGARINIINHMNGGDQNTVSSDNEVTVSESLPSLFDSNLYITVIDDQDRVVALKSVDEFRYVRPVPSDYAARVLKYNNPDSTGILYYIDIDDDSITVEYGFSSTRVNEPETYTVLSQSSIIDPTNTYLWIRITKGTSVKTASIELEDVGENWYVQYAIVDGTQYDWMEWTDQQVQDPDSIVFTTDPEIATGLYVKVDLVGSNYPLCTYKSFKLYKNPTNNKDLMKSMYYSEDGTNEYGESIGTEVASKTLTYSVTRSEYMTDSLILILREE